MKLLTISKSNIFVFLLAIVLLYNSYKKSFILEGYAGGAKDINKRFDNIENKYKNLKKVIAMLQAEIGLIKDTLTSKLKR